MSKTNMRAGWVRIAVALAIALPSCGAPSRAPAPVPQATAAAPSAILPPEDPHFEARIQELAVLSHPNNALLRFSESDDRASRKLAPGWLPTRGVESIRAFTIDGDVVSGVELSASERGRVLAIVRDALDVMRSGKLAKLACDFDPHQRLVFYDARKRVLGRIDVCFTCGEWQISPMPKGGLTEPVYMGDAQKPLRAVFDERHLGTFVYDEAEAHAFSEYLARVLGTPDALTPRGMRVLRAADEAPTGLDGTTPVGQQTQAEITQLWTTLRTAAAHPLRAPQSSAIRRDGGYAYSCVDGTKWFFDESPKPPPRTCTVSTARVETCLRAILRCSVDELCTGAPVPDCVGLEACLPGVHVQRSAPAR